MTTLTTRATKGAALTHNELDANFKRVPQTKAAGYTVAESDNRDTIEVSATATITLPDAATIAAAADTGDFEVTLKNTGTGTVTVTCTTGTDTIDGSTDDITIEAQGAATIKVNQAGNGYNVCSDSADTNQVGLVMLDTPTLIVNNSSLGEDTWTAYSGSDLSSVGAKVGILYIEMWPIITSASFNECEIHVRKGGSSVLNRKVGRITTIHNVVESRDVIFGVEAMVELDSSGHFDYKFKGMTPTGTGAAFIYINGYWK